MRAAAREVDFNNMEIAVLRSAALLAASATREISPSLPILNVPAKPYAKQNLLRDWTHPTLAIMRGMNIPKRAFLGASAISKVTKDEVEIIEPIIATTCLRRISPVPILHEPGIY